MKLIINLLLMAQMLTISGCIFEKNKLTMEIGDRSTVGSTDNPSTAIISSVSVVNNQLVLGGQNLAGVTEVSMTGPDGFSESFAIESKSEGTLVANSLQNISFLISGIFSLTISDASGASTFQVTFTLQDGAVTASKLSSMGAGFGNVLKYNGTTWVPGDLSALVYAGIWNANTNSPDLTVGGAAGRVIKCP